jgi:hypothetical protein
MAVFDNGLKFIREDPDLDPDHKNKLISEVNRSRSPGQTIRWIKALMIFQNPSFGQQTLSVRLETAKALLEGVQKKKQGNFSLLLEIFLPQIGMGAFDHETNDFPSLILDRIRGEVFLGIKALLVELIIRSPGNRPRDIQAGDYRAGLHHPDNIFKGRLLMFLEAKFKEEGLLIAIQEFGRLTPPPSIALLATFRSLLSNYPGIVERMGSINLGPGGASSLDPLNLPSKAKIREYGYRPPGWRWIDRAEIIGEGLLRREEEGLQRRLWKPEQEKAPEIVFPRVRLTLIAEVLKKQTLNKIQF